MSDGEQIPMSIDDLRGLASELQKDPLPFDPSTIRKGTVTAVDFVSTPPTISVQLSGDTTTTIAGVRIYNGYVPVVSDTVLLLKQGTDLLAWGKVATTAPGPDLSIRAGEITSAKTGTTNYIFGKLTTVNGTGNHAMRQPICHRIRDVAHNDVVEVTDTVLSQTTFTPTALSFAQVNATLVFNCDEGISGGVVEPARAVAWYRIVRVSDGVTVYTADLIYNVAPMGHDTFNTTSPETVTINEIGASLAGGTQYRIDFIAKRFSVLAVRFNHVIGFIQESVWIPAS